MAFDAKQAAKEAHAEALEAAKRGDYDTADRRADDSERLQDLAAKQSAKR